ncbi:dihydrofolate reductase family protein [Actinoallomurus bryophytorum]|uniref:Dihydrofolate reductase n=1 Tax=Actinoallomurus bryophytorum TaxID=1490222 RepID=A0A543CH86_9ACTN|nr:dihydrofolate reductase family protein [Actinoallomurus bryophytorum]TQL96469.1 dihydrofolate reductase [Actinoallomurus bryophytorum]
MRKIIYWVHTSIDGYVAGPGGAFDWASLGPELFGYSEAMNEQVDTLMYGRVVWDMMAAYWPTADADPATTDDHARAFAPFFRETPKVVVSRTLDKAGLGARVIGRNLAEEVEELKRRPGKDILLTGGAEVAASLSELGLLDDYRIVVHPVVLGGGRPLFLEPKDRLEMRLVDSRTFDSQTVLLRYERRA